MKTIAMASVSSIEERAEAHALGWRTFRIRTEDMPRLDGERICPASKEAGARTTCARCLACRGSEARDDIVVVGHGSANKIVALDRLLRRAEPAR